MRSMRRFGHLVAGSCALLLAFAACERAPRWPDEALLVGDRRALARLLDDLQGLEGTPLARAAEALAQDLPLCDTIQGRAAGNRLWGPSHPFRTLPTRSPINALSRQSSGRCRP